MTLAVMAKCVDDFIESLDLNAARPCHVARGKSRIYVLTHKGREASQGDHLMINARTNQSSVELYPRWPVAVTTQLFEKVGFLCGSKNQQVLH